MLDVPNWKVCSNTSCQKIQQCNFWTCRVDGTESSSCMKPQAISISLLPALSTPVCKIHRCRKSRLVDRWICDECVMHVG